jgi:hypothetical protein
MTMFLPIGSRIGSAAVMLLTLGLLSIGCSNRPDPRLSNAPPLNAAALSGGKITRFVPEPGLANDPAARAMLMACQQLPVTSRIARSASAVITTGQFGNFPLHALVIGKQVLVLPTDLATMGIEFGGSGSELILYPLSKQAIIIAPGGNWARVGRKKVKLTKPIIGVDHQLVMVLDDLLTVLGERDRQRHQSPFIRDVKIIYDIRDYHR